MSRYAAIIADGNRRWTRNRRLASRGTVVRAAVALLVANVRYWSTVAPTVRVEISGWEQRAEAIEDQQLRTLALAKLRGEGFHAEAAAMLATLAPRAHRKATIQAMVALELLYDYLDGLTERHVRNPLAEGEHLFGALIDAVALPRVARVTPRCGDGGYLEELSHGVACAMATLPAATAVMAAAHATAMRSAEAQTHMHAAPQLGRDQLEAWARHQAQPDPCEWRELLAGSASSVLALHALIAAAADPHTTRATAAQIPQAYLSICVLLTLLDGLIDHAQDELQNQPIASSYADLYEDPGELATALTRGAKRAVAQARALPHGPAHLMIMVGVVAYYSSAPGADGDAARPAIAALSAELRPLFSPAFAVMRIWRSARRRTHPEQGPGRELACT